MRVQAMVAATAFAGMLLPVGAASANTGAIKWGACQGKDFPADMRCASVDVPVNWAKPHGRKIKLDLGRLPATRPADRIGVMMPMAGGPGGSGVDNIKQRASSFTALRERFDVVAVAPRNATLRGELPESCYLSGPTLFAPATRQEYQKLGRTLQQSVRECRKADPEFFDSLDSSSVARDMDAVRAALGEAKLSIMGTSYGGRPIADYSRMFPNRVRAAYFDGTGNPVGDQDANERTLYKQLEGQFTRFVDWCATTGECALHGEDVAAVWRKLTADADRTPIPVSGQPQAAAYTGFDLKVAIGPYLQSPQVGPPGTGGYPGYVTVAKAIDKARHGDAADFADAVLKAFGTAKFPAPPASVATWCHDGAGYTGYREYEQFRRRGKELAPNLAGHAQRVPLTCTGWSRPTNPARSLPGNAGQPVAQQVRQRAHHPVARGVPAQVVDVLEVVQVEQQQRATHAQRQLALQFPGQRPPVRQAGQRVLLHHPEQVLVPVPQLGGPQFLVTPARHVHRAVQQVPVRHGDARDLQPPVVGLVPGPPRDHDRLVGRCLGHARQQRGQGPAHALPGAQPEQAGHPRVGPLHPAPLVGDGERDIAGRQHLAQ